jgi:hypothetical protein
MARTGRTVSLSAGIGGTFGGPGVALTTQAGVEITTQSGVEITTQSTGTTSGYAVHSPTVTVSGS